VGVSPTAPEDAIVRRAISAVPLRGWTLLRVGRRGVLLLFFAPKQLRFATFTWCSVMLHLFIFEARVSTTRRVTSYFFQVLLRTFQEREEVVVSVTKIAASTPALYNTA
jgi:hypothetical protein